MDVRVQYKDVTGKSRAMKSPEQKRKYERGKKQRNYDSDLEEDNEEDLFYNSESQSFAYGQDPMEDSNKKYKIEIIRKLLENFDLEKTLNKYRDMGSAEYVVNPADFSLDSSSHAVRMRTRLRELMGSEVIKINNKDFRNDLSARLRNQYEEDMRRKENKLAQLERKRLHRLLAEGVITTEDLHEDYVWSRDHESRDDCTRQGARSVNTPHSSRRYRPTSTFSRASRTTVLPRTPKSSRREQLPHRTLSAPGSGAKIKQSDKPRDFQRSPSKSASPRVRFDNGTIINQSAARPSTTPIRSSSDFRRTSSFAFESQMAKMMDSEFEKGNNESSKSKEFGIISEWDKLRRDKMCSPRSSTSSASGKRLPLVKKYSDPRLTQLYQEETVDGLFRISDTIIPPDRPKVEQDIRRPLTRAKPKPKLKFSLR